MGCLALNASYEPLTILSARRAVRLVIDQKAEILESDAERAFRSPGTEYPYPTVIRLVRYVHVPRRFRRQVTKHVPLRQRRLQLPVLWTAPRAPQGSAIPYAGPCRSDLERRRQLVGKRRHLMLAV